MSTTARKAWLRFLNLAGVKSFRATSAFGLPYMCYVGDEIGEAPFYNRTLSIPELAVMSAWCGSVESPVIFDIGANNGFISTQLAQLLRKNNPRIYAFEPVPTTFAQLEKSIDSLGLSSFVFPKRCAMSNSIGKATLFYDPRHSLFAQIRNDADNVRVGAKSVEVETTTIDQMVGSLAVAPHLLKVDVEGFEARVFQGASKLLSSSSPPAICFEWNPSTMSEVGNTEADMTATLLNYRLHYVDDFEGQRWPFGQPISELAEITWVCNIFAVPVSKAAGCWSATRDRATQLIEAAK